MTKRRALALPEAIELSAEQGPPALTPAEEVWLAEFRAQLRMQEELQNTRQRRQRSLHAVLLTSMGMMLAALAALVTI